MVGWMKKSIVIIICFLLGIIILEPMVAIGEKSLVFDKSHLFNQEEIENLQSRVSIVSETYDMDIVIVTTDDALGKTSREYADDFFDKEGFGVGNDYDGILFLIDMDNGEAYISTSGLGIRYLTDERIESILDQVFDGGLAEGNYYGATIGFINGIESYLERGIPSDQYNDPEIIKEKNRLTVTEFIISLVGAVGLGGAFYFTTKSRYKMKTVPSHFSYRNNSIVNFNSNEDKLINTYVTHRVIPKPTNTSGPTGGKSTTHRSSSGRTHGGGGRKF